MCHMFRITIFLSYTYYLILLSCAKQTVVFYDVSLKIFTINQQCRMFYMNCKISKQIHGYQYCLYTFLQRDDVLLISRLKQRMRIKKKGLHVIALELITSSSTLSIAFSNRIIFFIFNWHVV